MNEIMKNNTEENLAKPVLDNLGRSYATGKRKNAVARVWIKDGSGKVVSFAFDANKYFNDSQPWAIKEKNPERMNAILFTIVEQIKNISILLNPIIPNATKKVLAMINISNQNISIDKINDKNILNNKKEIGNLEILFTKIENDN